MIKLYMKQHSCKKELQEFNLRATPARIAIMNFLEKTKQPVDVNTIVKRINNEGIKTDPATVFRIMNMLTGREIVMPIQFQDRKTRYELTERKHHHHLVCESCGKIEDVLTQAIPTLEKEIQKKQKFLVKRHSLEFFGLCKDCQN